MKGSANPINRNPKNTIGFTVKRTTGAHSARTKGQPVGRLIKTSKRTFGILTRRQGWVSFISYYRGTHNPQTRQARPPTIRTLKSLQLIDASVNSDLCFYAFLTIDIVQLFAGIISSCHRMD